MARSWRTSLLPVTRHVSHTCETLTSSQGADVRRHCASVEARQTAVHACRCSGHLLLSPCRRLWTSVRRRKSESGALASPATPLKHYLHCFGLRMTLPKIVGLSLIRSRWLMLGISVVPRATTKALKVFDHFCQAGRGCRFKTSPEATALQWLDPSQTADKEQPYLFTQCQAIHARSLVPCQVPMASSALRHVNTCATTKLCRCIQHEQSCRANSAA